jgi:hypothetical protein
MVPKPHLYSSIEHCTMEKMGGKMYDLKYVVDLGPLPPFLML